jgi:MFS family permease
VRVWWIPPFLGRVPELEPRLVSLLGLVSLALFFESYDVSMLTAALKHIAQDLDISEANLGGAMATIRLGALPAFAIAPFADRWGRRRVFLATVVGSSVGTVVTGFAQTEWEFVLVQMVTRAFLIASAVVAVVIVTEEFPAEHRGWAIGMVGALSACGHGLGAVLFAMIDHLPFGWRALYAVGVVPLLLLPAFRRGVHETKRFLEMRTAGRAKPTPVWTPLVALARAHPGRALGVAAAAGLLGIGEVSVFQFTGWFAQGVHGWAPGQYSAMVLAAGGLGIVGNVVAGRLADRIGRRIVGATFFALFPVGAITFYNGPDWSMPIAFACLVFCQTAGAVMVRAFSTELFATAQRGTSSGWATLAQTLGWALGLWVVGLGTEAGSDIARMTSLLSFSVLLSGLTLLLLPETSRRELESISERETSH